MRQIAEAMLGMGLKFDLILSSPYVRAQQTAKIVAKALGKEVTFTKFLVPDADPLDLIAEINDEKPHTVLLVGHEPDLSQLISMLACGTTAGTFELKKGGLCKLTAETKITVTGTADAVKANAGSNEQPARKAQLTTLP